MERHNYYGFAKKALPIALAVGLAGLVAKDVISKGKETFDRSVGKVSQTLGEVDANYNAREYN